MEAAKAEYVDVGRVDGQAAVMKGMQEASKLVNHRAPPMLEVVKDGSSWSMSQTGVICDYLAERHGLAPEDEERKYVARQLFLTVLDIVDEAHNTHHPVAKSGFYEDQKTEAVRYAKEFITQRWPKSVSYFANTIGKLHGTIAETGPFIFGSKLTYVDLALWQTWKGVEYAFPKAYAAEMGKSENACIKALLSAVETDETVKAYLASDRRMAFSQHGIFRHYPELEQ